MVVVATVTDILRVEPVRAGCGSEGTSPAGRLTTKSVTRWPEPRLVQVRRKTDTSPSRVRESERQDENETGTESGMECTEVQDEVEEEIVILILRTETTQGKVYILVITQRLL